jgi:hypothetical protein
MINAQHVISIESILYILSLEKYIYLKFYQDSPYHNGGDGGGGCNTATAVGIDRQVNNQLKAAIDTGRGRPRGGGRGHGQRRHGSSL